MIPVEGNRRDEGPGIRVRIVGLGNVLMGDDGFGPYAVRVLDATWEFPNGVSLEDLGTPGFDLIPHKRP